MRRLDEGESFVVTRNGVRSANSRSLRRLRLVRGARAVDLMMAAIACAANLPLYTRNPADFAALDGIVEVDAI